LRGEKTHANNFAHEHFFEHCIVVVGSLKRPRSIVFKDDREAARDDQAAFLSSSACHPGPDNGVRDNGNDP
jgi:hypothetical protein